MQLQRINLTAFVTLVAVILAPLPVNFSMRLRASPVLAQTTNVRKAEADRRLQQGIQQGQTSQFEAAKQSFQQALTIYREIHNRPGEGAALVNLGGAYLYLGDYTKAIKYSQQSLAIAKELDDQRGEERALVNLGGAYYFLGDYAKAIDYQQQSLAIAKELDDRRGEERALVNLGGAYYSLGDYAKAINYEEQGLAIAKEIDDRRGEGLTLRNLGLAYFSLGDYAKAIDYQQQSLAIAKEIYDRQGEGQDLGNLGLAYFSLGDHAKAIDYYQQRLALAKEIDDRRGEGAVLGNLGAAYYSLGDDAKAIDYQQQSLAIAKEIHNQQGEGTALGNLGVALLRSGHLADAEKTLRDGIQVWESQRTRLGSNDAFKVSIFEQQVRTYRALQQVLIAQNQPDAALEIAERGRARAFVELLARRLASNQTQPATITPPTIEQLKQIAHNQNAALVEYSIIYDEFKVQGKTEPHESALYIWVISPSGAVTFRSCDLKPLWQKQNTTLADLVVSSRESMGVGGRGGGIGVQPDETSQAQSLQQLHQLLIKPIAALLPSDPSVHVIFLPQDSLFLVPFPALQDASGNYLIQQHTILTAPAIQVLDLTHQQQQRVPLSSAKDILVVGNPTMPKVRFQVGALPEQLPSLPGAQQEAIDIATLLHTQALTGNQATKAAIVPLLPQARIIHLATHGLLDDFTGLGVPGAIALAPSGQDDGLLTASNILDMKLNAELVVLSACDTGRGRITGDGIIGLSRSLISAGVPSVIVSLWSIPDAPTASLMTEFYQHLQHNPDKAQALRQAMLLTMKQHPNPRDWAAFTLIGEAR